MSSEHIEVGGQAIRLCPLGAILVVIFLAFAAATTERALATDVLVGAFRWDFWTPDSRFSKIVLDPDHSADRTPFFAHRKSDGSQVLLGGLPFTVDAEAQYASAGGLDYWIFGYYVESGTYGRSPEEAKQLNSALRSFVQLPHRYGMRFALQLNQNSPRVDIFAFADEIAKLIVDRDYLRTENGVAPVFIYRITSWEKALGQTEAVQNFFSDLADMVRKRTGVELAYVLTNAQADVRARYIKPGSRFRAFTYYVYGPPNDGRAYSAAECFALARRGLHEAQFAAEPFLPNVTLGWDPRPITFFPEDFRMYSPTFPAWCEPLRGESLKQHIRKALEISSRHPSSDFFRSIVIYAWNEFAEGGWLAPTRRDGQARLSELAAALGRDRAPSRTAIFFPAGDDWPCPLNMRPEQDEAVSSPIGERHWEVTKWTKRICSR